MNIQITKKDVNDARRVYWWLLLAPLVAVPCWGFNLTSASGELPAVIWASVLPLIFYLPVFIWAFAPNPYLKAHARQGVILLALRFFCGVLVGAGAWYLMMGNLFLWFVGSMIGLTDASAGRTWLGNIRAEIIPYAAPQTSRAPQTLEVAGSQEQTQYYLKLFRTGDVAARAEAVRKLETLAQVETF